MPCLWLHRVIYIIKEEVKMASIRVVKNKSGISYRIQVKVINEATGELVIKSKTWRPATTMTNKQSEREVILVADKFDKEVRDALTGSMAGASDMGLTLKQYCEKWLVKRKGDLALSTYVHYIEALKFVNEYIGGVKLSKLTPFIIQNFYDKLDSLKKVSGCAIGKPIIQSIIKKKGLTNQMIVNTAGVSECVLTKAKKGGRISIESADKITALLGMSRSKLFDVVEREEEYAYETMHKHKRCLRAILSTAKKQRLIADNYASSEYITFTKRPDTEIEFMDDNEAKKFFKAIMQCQDIKVKTAMLTLLMTGIRRGEIAGLNWSDIDFENSTLSISRSYVAVNGFGVTLKEPKTASSKRVMAIPSVLTELLKEYKLWYDEEQERYGDKWIEDESLFFGVAGERVYPQTVDKWLDRILSEAGLRHFTLHSVRHTNITLQIMAGVPVAIVSSRAGHARTSTTSDIYTHVIKSVDRTAADTLNNMFN